MKSQKRKGNKKHMENNRIVIDLGFAKLVAEKRY